MARNTKHQKAPSGKRIDLDAALDTGGTLGNPAKDTSLHKRNREDIQEVDPAFNDAPESLPFSFRHITLTMKILAVILPAGATAVWYLSKLDSNVDVLKTNVGEVRVRTEELLRTSIQHGEKLETLEKSVEVLSAKDGTDTKKK